MKHLAPFVFDDIAALDRLERSKGNISVPLKNGLKHALGAMYADYSSKVSNPMVAVPRFEKLAISSAILLAAYESPPVAIQGLKEFVQRELSPNVCPMCGSLKTGTVDHYLPKSKFPEYSFYSKNLVPACDCNTKRGEALFGPNLGEFVLHPFFEPLMSQRIISVDFAFALGGRDPVLSICKLYPSGMPAAAIDFHVKSIHAKTTMLSWIKAEWGRLLDVPLSVLIWRPRHNPVSVGEVRERMEDVLASHDDKLGTPNNWSSALFHGVLNSPGALDRVADAINDYIIRSSP